MENLAEMCLSVSEIGRRAHVEKLLCHKSEHNPQPMKQWKTPRMLGRKTARMVTAARSSLLYQTIAAFSILDLGIWNKKWAHHSDVRTQLYEPFSILVQQKERKARHVPRARVGYEDHLHLILGEIQKECCGVHPSSLSSPSCC